MASTAVVETSSPFDGSYTSVAIQGDGKIVAAGSMSTLIGSGGPHSKIMVARYSADGALDTASFGTDDSDGLDGIVVTDTSVTSPSYDVGIGTDLALQGDGKLVVTGSRGLDGTGNAFFSLVGYLGDDPAPLPPVRALWTDFAEKTMFVQPATQHTHPYIDLIGTTAPAPHYTASKELSPRILGAKAAHAPGAWDTCAWDWLSAVDDVFSVPATR